MEEQLPKKFGKYTLLRRLAVGGMAEIFLALHRSLSGFEKLLVIKRILPNLTQDPDFLRMFLDEARIAATLNHPNVVQIYDVGSVGESTYIAMEHIHGEDLRSIVKGMKKSGISAFPLELALQVIVGVCAGLEYAHTRADLQGQPLEIVHRDISPQNVLVTFGGDVKVVDFGIARAKVAGAECNTGRGQLKGKIPYMSPEQARGKELDRRSDIFSTGIILFELTTGRRMFRGSTEFNTLRKIVEEEYPRPSQFKEDYPPDLERIVMKALEKDVDDRYESARELRADLEEFIREHRIRASSLALSKFLEEIFAEKIASQREALAQGKRLADIIAAEEAASETSSDAISLEGPPVSDSIGSAPGPSTSAWVEEKKSNLARRLAVAVVALVVVLGFGGAIFFFTRPAETTIELEPMGVLEVRSTPEGATISLEGTDTDERTPHTFTELRVDRTYQVKLSLDGYRHELREVNLSSAHPRETVALELSPSGTGILAVNTVPAGATVFLDGRQLEGHTPLTIPDVVPIEEHRIVIKLVGYHDTEDQVTVAPGRIVEANFELEDAPLGADETHLVVTSEPEGAHISLDGRRLEGVTPFEKRLRAGKRVTLELALDGYQTYEERVSLRAGRKVTIDANLQRDRGARARGEKREPRPVETQPSGSGRLYFDAVPFCIVTIDGRSYGPTPIVNAELPAGRRRVRCTSPPIGVTKTFTVEVPSGGTVRRRVKLRE